MNKYEIIGIVGEGAYGIVYKAKCKETGEFGKLPTIISIDIDAFGMLTCLVRHRLRLLQFWIDN